MLNRSRYQSPVKALIPQPQLNFLGEQSCLFVLIQPKKRTHQEYVDVLLSSSISVLDIYQGNKKKINHQCKICDYIFLIRPNDVISSGVRCSSCAGNVIPSQKEYLKKLIKSNPNIYPLENYITSKIKINHQCKICDYIWKVRPNNILNKHCCPNCSNTKRYSIGEKEVSTYIKTIYNGRIVENDRTILKPKELDVYLPDIGFAVEYNGDYWHNMLPKGYHSDKTTRCADQGIQLLHIWESDWKADIDLCKSRIKSHII